ncbi:hypothetical protein GH714_035940 [Hevea brasiliensis]|uniref:PCI domain-containing protein n=1 Tax=Hevea brasiliensis TaxID=3981 RepID=A0A6A6M7B7_HEVBR|nr:hypothetical protein GH714_035940 [Hevea brasiliensis]
MNISTTTRATMATYDLTPRIAPNLDRHLVFPLLEFLQERQLYPEEQIFKSKIELLNKTNMVDYAMDIHKSLYHTEDVPQDMVERRAEVVARLKALEEGRHRLWRFCRMRTPCRSCERTNSTIFKCLMTVTRYLNAIQTNAPHFEVILNDPFLGKQIEDGNFSTVPLRDEFLENARLFIYETYCRIHQRIDMGVLAEKLNLNYEEAERWIVNLIRNSKLDAKIDSKLETVIMEPNYPNVYEQLIDHTKALSGRTYKLVSQLLDHAQAQATR